MEKPVVYVAEYVEEKVLNYLREHVDLRYWPLRERISMEKLLHEIKDAVGIILDGIKVDSCLLDAAPNLKAVSNISVGYNNCDIDELKKRNIICTNTPGVLDDTVADLIVGLMLSAARRIPELDRYVKDGRWKKDEYYKLFGKDLHHSKVGIIGMGRIGEALAKRLTRGFEAEVMYFNRNRKYDTENDLGVVYKPMRELLWESDFVVVMTPLNNETYHLFDYAEFDNMKNGGIFINASRGAVVNETALISTLKSGKLFAAGLDVFEREPVDGDNELLNMERVVTLPHIGSATEKTTFEMSMLAAKNMVSALYTGDAPNKIF